mmetsp:Transcript_2748/g.11307  ORF Transcript_2748/g.11307 Transcript_2748/m.11307 type:complete len:329 (-) Transcript_2748:265-1251(-)
MMLETETTQYFLLSAGTIFFLTTSCYVEEWIFKVLPDFDYFGFVALAELLMFAGFSYLGFRREAEAKASDVEDEGGWKQMGQRKSPLGIYIGVGLSMAIATSVGKVAYKYVNYATGTVLKSMKLLPVLVLSMVYLKRTFGLQDYAIAILMTISAIAVGLGDSKDDPNFDVMGVILSFVCLFAQAIQNNGQDQALRDYNASVAEAMLFSNGIAAVFAFANCVISGELVPALVYFFEPRRAVLLFIRSITFYIGAQLYVSIIKRYGAVAAVTVTTARKILTIILSFVLFSDNKPYTALHFLGSCAFALATILEINQRTAKAKAKPVADKS